MNQSTCQVCKKKFDNRDLFPLELVHDALLHIIKKSHKEIDPRGFICFSDLEHYQTLRSRQLLKQEVGEMTEAEEEVLHSLHKRQILAENINSEYQESLTFGQRTADRISSFGGSWRFIGIFFSILLGWMMLNTWILFHDPFDPYPYILLNLVLSCLAAIQAPIIMMSQNRQAHKDRLTAENDYKVNLKSEILLLQLTAKFDHQMKRQWMRLMESQNIQLEMSQAILNIHRKMGEDMNEKPI